MATLIVSLPHPLARLSAARQLDRERWWLTVMLDDRITKGRRVHRGATPLFAEKVDRLLLDYWPPLGLPANLKARSRRSGHKDLVLPLDRLNNERPPQLGCCFLWLSSYLFPALSARFVFRGGLSAYFLLGVRVVRGDGRRAGRFRLCLASTDGLERAVPPCRLVLFSERYAAWRSIPYLGDLCWMASGVLNVAFAGGHAANPHTITPRSPCRHLAGAAAECPLEIPPRVSVRAAHWSESSMPWLSGLPNAYSASLHAVRGSERHGRDRDCTGFPASGYNRAPVMSRSWTGDGTPLLLTAAPTPDRSAGQRHTWPWSGAARRGPECRDCSDWSCGSRASFYGVIVRLPGNLAYA